MNIDETLGVMNIDDILDEQRKALAEAQDMSVYGTAEAMHSLKLSEDLFVARQACQALRDELKAERERANAAEMDRDHLRRQLIATIEELTETRNHLSPKQ